MLTSTATWVGHRFKEKRREGTVHHSVLDLLNRAKPLLLGEWNGDKCINGLEAQWKLLGSYSLMPTQQPDAKPE